MRRCRLWRKTGNSGLKVGSEEGVLLTPELDCSPGRVAKLGSEEGVLLTPELDWSRGESPSWGLMNAFI